MSLFSDTIAPVRRSQADELFLIRIVAKPLPEDGKMADAGGAYVTCWIDADDLHTAEEAALEQIRAEQWQPTKFEHWELVRRQGYVDDSRYAEEERGELLEQVDQAFEHGISLTFDCWPDDAHDSNTEYT